MCRYLSGDSARNATREVIEEWRKCVALRGVRQVRRVECSGDSGREVTTCGDKIDPVGEARVNAAVDWEKRGEAMGWC